MGQILLKCDGVKSLFAKRRFLRSGDATLLTEATPCLQSLSYGITRRHRLAPPRAISWPQLLAATQQRKRLAARGGRRHLRACGWCSRAIRALLAFEAMPTREETLLRCAVCTSCVCHPHARFCCSRLLFTFVEQSLLCAETTEKNMKLVRRKLG